MATRISIVRSFGATVAGARLALRLGWRAMIAVILVSAALLAPMNPAAAGNRALPAEIIQSLEFTEPDEDARQQNGFFRMLGLDAPAGQDAWQFGERRFAEQLRMYREFAATAERAELPVQEAAHWSSPSFSCADPEEADCLAAQLAQLDAIRAGLRTHAELLERYEGLAGDAIYEEIVPPYMPAAGLIPYQSLRAAASWRLARASLLLAEGRGSQALALLQQEAALQRRIMEGCRSVACVMALSGMALERQRFVSSLLRHAPELAADSNGIFEDVLQAAKPPLREMLEQERRFILVAVDAAPRGNHFSLGPGELQPGRGQGLNRLSSALAFQRGRTLEAAYARYQRMVDLATVAPSQLALQAREIDRGWDRQRQAYLARPGGLNSGGRRLVMDGPSIEWWFHDVERVHDAEGHRRLVLLQLAALRDAVDAHNMAEWLVRSPARLRDPYTGEAMAWDAQHGTLVFQGHQGLSEQGTAAFSYRVLVHPPADGRP